MLNTPNIGKEARALERTLTKIRKCVESTYLLCTPYNSKEYVTMHWCQLIRTLWLYKGPREAVNQIKEYNRIVKLSFQHEVIPEDLRVKWCKCDRRGLPKDISFLRPWLESTTLEDRRFALDVLNTYRLIYLPPQERTDSIVTEGSGLMHDRKEWRKFLTFWVKKFRPFKFDFDEKNLGWGTTKQGPNGPSLMSPHLDATALYNCAETSDSFVRWTTATGQSKLIAFSKGMRDEAASLKLKHKVRHSKLSFISEGGGKTRVIAIADYWTQLSLHGIHKYTMECLRQLTETDGTFSHNEVVRKLIPVTQDDKHDIFSLDLKDATDRFPVSLQEDLLSRIVGQEAAEAWTELLVKRNFFTKHNDKVRYSVGQPMGLLSSWSVFSLTHHAIIEFAAFKEGFPAFRDYYVIGDDVVIMNDLVANRYLKLMSEIGVDISIPKSFISKKTDKFRILEFAKRIIVNGVDMSPIPVKLIDEARRDIFMFPTLIKKLRDLDRGLAISQETHFCKSFYGAIPKMVALIMTAPKYVTGMEPWTREDLWKHYSHNFPPRNAPIEGFTFSPEEDTMDVKLAWIRVRIEHLKRTQDHQIKGFMREITSPEGPFTSLKKSFERKGIPISNSVIKRETNNPYRLHPLINKIQHLHWTFWSVEDELRTMLENVSELTEAQLVELKLPEFMPQINYNQFLGFSQQEARTRVTLVRRLHDQLSDQVSHSDRDSNV
jgi:hypothetical protein